jgi:Skp family chaperone for outer membrane proteins
MKRILLALLAAAALSAPADTKIATVDFGFVVLAHPQTPRNRAELLDMQAKFAKQRDERLAARDKIKEEFEAARAIALDPVQGAAARDQAAAKAKDLQMQYARATDAVQDLVDELRRKLQRREGELFANVMIDVRAKIEEIAKAKGFDLVVDKKSANLAAGVPTPVFLYASDAIDVTDDVIAAIGGSREQAEKDQALLLDRASALFGREAAPDAPAEGSEAKAPEAPAAKEAK